MRLLAALVLLLATIVPVAAFEDPKSLVEAFYAQYDNLDEQRANALLEDTPSFRSEGLNALYARDEEEANGDVGRIDFDPFVDGQDVTVTNLMVSEPVIEGDTATIAVTLENFGEPRDLVISAVREKDGWKLDDVRRIDGDYPYRLRDILEAPL